MLGRGTPLESSTVFVEPFLPPSPSQITGRATLWTFPSGHFLDSLWLGDHSFLLALVRIDSLKERIHL